MRRHTHVSLLPCMRDPSRDPLNGEVYILWAVVLWECMYSTTLQPWVGTVAWQGKVGKVPSAPNLAGQGTLWTNSS